MNLPNGFNNATEYFEELVLFLQNYSWLYESPVTSFLTLDIFSKLPDEWEKHLLECSNEELNCVPIGLIKEEWPSSLKRFCQDCQRFTLPVLTANAPVYKPVDVDKCLQLLPQKVWEGMSQKKKGEVEMMSSLVHDECKVLRVGKILDLGSGLGYIDRLLLLRGYTILGIESEVKLVAFSTKQKDNLFPPNIANNLMYYNMNISEKEVDELKYAIFNLFFATKSITTNNSNNIKNVKIYEWNKVIPLCLKVSADDISNKVCMIGLHACGDLAVTGIKMYLNLPEVSALVLVPCCYHKMSLTENCSKNGNDNLCTDNVNFNDTFNNFPLSETLVKQSSGAKFLCRPFLRLANQTTNTSWQDWTEADHHSHSFNVLSRAIIELFVKQEGTMLKKCFRRVVRKSSVNANDFSSYIDESLSRCQFINEEQSAPFKEDKDKIRCELLNMWEKHKSKLKCVEVLTALQMCLEPVAESLVVADRICFLKENQVDNVRVVKMMDNKLSPRCLAYVASK